MLASSVTMSSSPCSAGLLLVGSKPFGPGDLTGYGDEYHACAAEIDRPHQQLHTNYL
jgi:hypothetical protein